MKYAIPMMKYFIMQLRASSSDDEDWEDESNEEEESIDSDGKPESLDKSSFLDLKFMSGRVKLAKITT